MPCFCPALLLWYCLWLLLHVLLADVVVMLNRNLEYCSYASTALYGTDDFDELEQQYNKVGWCQHYWCTKIVRV